MLIHFDTYSSLEAANFVMIHDNTGCSFRCVECDNNIGICKQKMLFNKIFPNILTKYYKYP